MIPGEESAITKVCFLGDPDGELCARLTAIGVPLVFFSLEMTGKDSAPQEMIIVDGNTYTGGEQEDMIIRKMFVHNKKIFIYFRMPTALPEALKKYIGDTKCVPLAATQLSRMHNYEKEKDIASTLSVVDLYFAEEPGDRHVIKCGLDGEILQPWRVLLMSAPMDWTLFNESPEAAKCAAACLYKHLKKPSGVALAIRDHDDGGTLYVTTIDVIPESPKNVALWKTLLGRVGVKFVPPPATWLVKNAERGQPGAEWKYTTEMPAENWMAPDFNDAKWLTGPAGFGTGVPGIHESATRWDGTDIWLRAAFDSDAETPFSDLLLSVYHDEDVTIYINGERVLHRTGHISQHERFPLAASNSKLKKGRNVIAVHCLQTEGGQFIDVGLCLKSAASAAAKKEHNLLMDGPPME